MTLRKTLLLSPKKTIDSLLFLGLEKVSETSWLYYIGKLKYKDRKAALFILPCFAARTTGDHHPCA
jgi:hypothetical protein